MTIRTVDLELVRAATTHEDLHLDLKPDIWVRKGFGMQSVYNSIRMSQAFPKECTLRSDLKIEECKHEELKELEKVSLSWQ